jgi:hypothetical protein
LDSRDNFFPILLDYNIPVEAPCRHDKAAFLNTQGSQCGNLVPDDPNIDELMRGEIEADYQAFIPTHDHGLLNLIQQSQCFLRSG